MTTRIDRDGPLVWYVTPHGYGHATRSCEVIHALRRTHPETPVILATTHPEALLRTRLEDDAVRVRHVALDDGLIMRDAVTMDLKASLLARADRRAAHAGAVRDEAQFLRNCGARLVAADIPAAAFEAAEYAGVPSLGLGNFSWSWVYASLARDDPRWAEAAEAMRNGESRAGRLLRYPAHEPMSGFHRIEDVPFPSRAGRRRRKDIAARTGLDPDRRWALMSFAALDLPAAALEEMSASRTVEWISVLPLAWPGRPHFHAVRREDLPFRDLMASCDAVLTKPGHGILGECVAAGAPMACVERPDWPEHDVLMGFIRRHVRHATLSIADLARGGAEAAVCAAISAPAPSEPPPPADPAAVAERVYALWRP